MELISGKVGVKSKGFTSRVAMNDEIMELTTEIYLLYFDENS